jgi:hypothetical protein
MQTLPGTIAVVTPPKPFDPTSEDADVIIRSSDDVDFRVIRAFLAFSSPVFKAMFTLPQYEGTSSLDETRQGLPIIAVTENSTILYHLLRYCYPIDGADEVEMKSLEEVSGVLETARKYSMAGVEWRARRALVSSRFIDKEAVRVFALALYHGLEAEARVAAVKTLSVPTLGRPYIREFEYITAGDFLRLNDYQEMCKLVAVRVAQGQEALAKGSWVWLYCRGHCSSRTSPATGALMAIWWLEYLEAAAKALAQRPIGDTVANYELLDKALAKANACPACRDGAFRDLMEFTKVFAAAVDEATSKVRVLFIAENWHSH